MKYEICEKTLSKARLNKYSQACEQDKSKAIWLYQCNMKLSQRFYGVIGLFEVMLRNAINEHYKQQFGDEDWIVNQCAPGCLLADDKEAIEKAYKDFTSKGVYTNGKMVLLSRSAFGHTFLHVATTVWGRKHCCAYSRIRHTG